MTATTAHTTSGAGVKHPRIGILGGGQLGRMLGMSARSLGYGVVVWAGHYDAPARVIADKVLTQPHGDLDGTIELMRTCDLVTLEWENMPAELSWREPGALERFARRLDHLARWRNVRDLANPDLSPRFWPQREPSHRLRLRLSLEPRGYTSLG